MITDLFSHKIHSSSPEWPEKLIELAFIFNDFDKSPFNRDQIENSLRRISPRSAYVIRDRSKFRDEYSAYPAYFGLYRMELHNGQWYIYLSETAKKYLIREEPDIASFLRIQMALFQYPNGMGAAYYSNSDRLRLQVNTRDRSLEFISGHVHLSPLRLIVTSLFADAELRNIPLIDSKVSYEEIFALANHTSLNQIALPDINQLKSILQKIRQGAISPPRIFERRFHILKHLELFEIEEGFIRPGTVINPDEEDNLLRMLHAYLEIGDQFNGFDEARTGADLERLITQGIWGNYFDGLVTLNTNIVNILAPEPREQPSPTPTPERVIPPEPSHVPIRPPASQIPTPPIQLPFPTNANIYPFRERDGSVNGSNLLVTHNVPADPEVTRIKRQRRNLIHKIIMDQTEGILRSRGAIPLENEHIDLYAEIPQDGAFLFEIKSGGESLLDQIRKGLSQLYEYKFRYRNVVRSDSALCMVLPSRPVPWLIEYLYDDRGICVCWFNQEGRLEYPDNCATKLRPLAM